MYNKKVPFCFLFLGFVKLEIELRALNIMYPQPRIYHFNTIYVLKIFTLAGCVDTICNPPCLGG